MAEEQVIAPRRWDRVRALSGYDGIAVMDAVCFIPKANEWIVATQMGSATGERRVRFVAPEHGIRPLWQEVSRG